MTVLKVENIPFEPAKELTIKQLLSHSGIPLLEIHVRGKVAEAMAQSASKMLACEDKPNMELAAKDCIAKGRRYETFLDVLRELQGEKTFAGKRIISEKE